MKYYAKAGWPYSVASGGLVYRGKFPQIEFLLLYRENDPIFKWHLPKGVLEDGETLEETALSEISEEAAVNVEIMTYLGALHSVTPPELRGYEIDKTSHYFLCKYVSDTGQSIDTEHDGKRWCSEPEARKNLKDSPKFEYELIDRALDWLAVNEG